MEDKAIETDLEDKLSTLVFLPDSEPTITIEVEHCPTCDGRPCILVCPAGLFNWEGDRVTCTWEKCLECGACPIVCPYGAIRLRFPREGRGVRYRWG
jgi:ferredoxin like protein